MVHIKTTKGLDIPIKGKPAGNIQSLVGRPPEHISLNLQSFQTIKFKIFVQVGDFVKLGQPLAEDKDNPGRFFVAPASGTIREIRRGLKRRLLDIVINVDPQEQIEKYPQLNVQEASREQLIDYFKATGLLTHIRQRPFNLLANPNQEPRHIFVKAVESAPFVPPAELQVSGYEREFQFGLDVLHKLTQGNVHLVYRQGTNCRAFTDAKNVVKHTVEGPHPVSNVSLHIQKIAPIHTPDDSMWTLNAHDVIGIGYSLIHHRYFVDRVISIGGPGIREGKEGFFKVREGYPIMRLIEGRLFEQAPLRFISGDVLTGQQVGDEDFLGFYDYSIVVIPENTTREFLHFFRLGSHKYTFTGTYLSGLFKRNKKKDYSFTTSLHGEHRPFIDGGLYQQVMPLQIPTMHLVKAILAEDYDTAVELGLLEVDSEDFALPSFICPSKIDMDHIVKKGLERYAADILK